MQTNLIWDKYLRTQDRMMANCALNSDRNISYMVINRKNLNLMTQSVFTS